MVLRYGIQTRDELCRICCVFILWHSGKFISSVPSLWSSSRAFCSYWSLQVSSRENCEFTLTLAMPLVLCMILGCCGANVGFLASLCSHICNSSFVVMCQRGGMIKMATDKLFTKGFKPFAEQHCKQCLICASCNGGKTHFDTPSSSPATTVTIWTSHD